jgi:hypothetical protein
VASGLTVAFTTCSLHYMTDDPKRAVLELALCRWAADRRESDETRDDLVRGAVAAGISKHRVHVLTGIARTTIDDILKKGRA